MLILEGKYNQAKVFTDNIEAEAIAQIIELCNQKFVEGETLRFMPDVHKGAGCAIGTTMTITGRIVPNLVGVDIGCGVSCVALNTKEIDLVGLDEFIHKHIPSGFSTNSQPVHGLGDSEWNTGLNLPSLYSLCAITEKGNTTKFENAIGSLGGGNHFIEIDQDEEGWLYLLIHTGSRNLGKRIADFYQARAVEHCKENYADYNIPKGLEFIEEATFRRYIMDMKIAQKYAKINRATIQRIIRGHLELPLRPTFGGMTGIDTIHNYIDIQNRILRKGAVSATEDELFLLPISMKEGTLVCRGKGNVDWNNSAPHGAGRLMSRSQAKRELSLDNFVDEMKGIYSTTVGQGTIDEAPGAYKPMDEILENIVPTADIVKWLTPIYNFKASEVPKWMKNRGR